MFKPERFAKPEWATTETTGDEEWRVTLRNFGKGLVWVLIVTAVLLPRVSTLFGYSLPPLSR